MGKVTAGLDEAVRNGLIAMAQRDANRQAAMEQLSAHRNEGLVENVAAPVGAYLSYQNARYPQDEATAGAGAATGSEDAVSRLLGKVTRGTRNVFTRSFWNRENPNG